MSIANYLVCMECKSAINLGKAVRSTYEYVNKPTFRFTGLDFHRDNIGPRLLCTIESLDHFFMLHRYHDLRVMPDTVVRFAEVEDFPHYWPDTDNDGPVEDRHQTFMELPVTAPDPDREIKNLPSELIEKLKEF